MANNGQIKIQIGGDADGLAKAAAQGSTALNDFNKAAQAAATGVSRLPPATAPASRGLGIVGKDAITAASALKAIPPAAAPAAQGLGKVATSTNTAAAALAKLNPGANQATFALTNLGRIAQDAPFGLIGIANNIEPAIASFISLRKETGSAGGAFKALGASLLGPGGLILGVGLISTVATLAGQGLFSAAKEADKFGEAMSEANKEAGKEIAELRIAASVASDVTRSMNDRKAAAKSLQDQLKESNITLSQEAILNGQVADAINRATTAIKERAKARAIENRIAELSAENLDREIRRPELLQKFLGLQRQYNAAKEKESKIPGAPSTISPELVGLFTAARNELLALDQATLDTSAEINKLLGTVKAEDLSFDFDEGKEKKQVDLLKQRIDALKTIRDETGLATQQQRELVALEVQLLRRDGVKLGFTPEEVEERVTNLIQNTRFGREADGSILATVPVKIVPTIDVAGSVLQGGLIPENAFDPMVEAFRKGAEEAKQKITAIVIDLRDLLSGVLSSAFVGLGESIASAFSGGGFSSVINGFISVIGDAISALGKAAIQAGTAALLLKKTLQKFIVSNPALVIAAGVAAVAIGSALKSAFNNTKVPGFADGITNFSGGAALVGERGPEIVTLPAGANVIPNSPFDALTNITLASEIRGDDIYLSYNRTSGRRRRI